MCAAKAKVLVLDGMWNKSLASVRSFGRRGFYVAAGEKTRFATALFSKYCNRRLVYPSAKEKTQEFINWLERELNMNKYDVLFPMELTTQRVITSNKNKLSKYCHIPFDDSDISLQIQDKAFLMKFANENGLDIPKTYIIDNLSMIYNLANDIDFPVVIKPRISSGSRGIAYVEKRENFITTYLKIHKKYQLPIIQEYIPKGGDAIGVGMLLNFKSEVKASFVYKRLREYPLKGGPSTLRVSIKMDDAREIAKKLLESLKWTGIAHVEFKVDPRDGKPKLLEVNPRFWGSLQLAIEAGVDFPYLLYKLAVDGDIEPVHDYQTGIMCRWLIPGDLLHFLSNPDRFRLKPGFFNMKIKDDILSIRDPMPVIGRISSIFAFFSDKEMRNILKRR